MISTKILLTGSLAFSKLVHVILFLNLLENRRGIYCICSGYMDLLFLLDFNLKMLVQYLLTVTPVVGLLPDKSKFEPIANPSEVESVFDVPLEMFLKVQYGPLSMYEYL